MIRIMIFIPLLFSCSSKQDDFSIDNTGNLEMELRDAVIFESPEKVIDCLRRGANPNIYPAYNDYGSLLEYSITKNNKQIYLSLISHGAELDHLGPDLTTAIVVAAYSKNLGIFKDLIDKGQRLKSNDRTFLVGMPREYIDYLYAEQKRICGYDELEIGFDSTVDQLVEYCQKGDTKNVLILLNCFPFLSDAILYYTTPLGFAISYHHESLTEMLINFGVDLNKKDLMGITPAMLSLKWHRPDVTQKLVMAGADANDKTYYLESLLHESVAQRYVDLTQFLLERAADPNVFRMYNYESPLTLAIGNNDCVIVEMLLKHGASPTQKNHKGKSATDFINKNTLPCITQLLIKP